MQLGIWVGKVLDRKSSDACEIGTLVNLPFFVDSKIHGFSLAFVP